MKWVSKFIEENEGGWKRERIRRGKVSLEEWEMLSENEKQEEILRNEKQKEKSKRKSNSWREWRPPATLSAKENPGNMLLNDLNKTFDEQEMDKR